jgi:hypothetical protein
LHAEAIRLKGEVACAFTGIFPGFEDGDEEEIIKGKPRIPFIKLILDQLATLTLAMSIPFRLGSV